MEPDCPRCGNELTTFSLAGVEALSCETCGYVGLEADHTGKPRADESWETAIRRFHDDR
ncbi:zf-TFIIB domain-containing protein [Halorubrum sp. DTA98]|uniref:zf-TFIIB domain-containing protein n=1 Tax=Halorubrum sp. DTA98 TaxID=3402163 RepID=UPI003AAD84EA